MLVIRICARLQQALQLHAMISAVQEMLPLSLLLLKVGANTLSGLQDSVDLRQLERSSLLALLLLVPET
jgi:hypothetical protein